MIGETRDEGRGTRERREKAGLGRIRTLFCCGTDTTFADYVTCRDPRIEGKMGSNAWKRGDRVIVEN